MQQHAITHIHSLDGQADQGHGANNKTSSTTEEAYFEAVSVKCIKLGEFVRKIGKDGKMQSKTYQRGEYNRATKTYSLTDCADVNREVSVKASVKLAVGFTY